MEAALTDQLPRILQQLIRDHRNMARLLDVLQEELEHYRQTKKADFEVLSRIVDYVLNFPELRHHPREDLVFRHLRRKNPLDARQAEAILAEHRDLGALTRKLSAAVHNLWHDVEMPRPWFESAIADFISKYRQHMREEEEIYFPLALKTLEPADWRTIDAEIGQPGDDPLFGGKTDAEYQSLHDRILRLAR
jgi:hemerythrin-like domain-containing protein